MLPQTLKHVISIPQLNIDVPFHLYDNRFLPFRANFLHLDIFYKELSYEVVEQTPAFELLSLLSEVGGFLGLLLGASVLTLCELLDYVIISCLRYCRKKGQVESQSG